MFAVGIHYYYNFYNTIIRVLQIIGSYFLSEEVQRLLHPQGG